MTETTLNSKDKLRLKTDIKISMGVGLLFSLALIIIVGLITGMIFIFGKQPSDGFVKRALFTFGLLFIPSLAISWTNILKYFDLRKGKKLIIKTNDYNIVSKRDSAFILTSGNNKRKIKIQIELVPFIKSSQPLTIEISNLSKSLLFISNDNDNLLDNPTMTNQ
jgi:hypothetical protein